MRLALLRPLPLLGLLALLSQLSLTAACTHRKPQERDTAANDPWEDYGLDHEGQDAGDGPRGRPQDRDSTDGAAPEANEQAGEPAAEPHERLDAALPPTPADGLRFDELLELKLSTGTKRMISRVFLRGEMIRQDQFADAARTQPTISEIRREGKEIRLDHAQRTSSSSMSVFDDMNDPSVVYFFQQLKDRRKWQEDRRETFEGQPCTVYIKPAPSQLRQKDELWVADEPAGFLLHYRSKNLLNIESILTRTAPVAEDVDPTLFRAPPGYAQE